ncbi:hypothetical protein K6I34_001790 [Streptomyces sp. UNOC14_S4]|nr:hypothetical protein [Streptomyces sp. UNOC14_S4]
MHDRYRVKADAKLNPPGVPLEPLGALAAALNAAGTPIADALEELMSATVEL